MVDPTDASAAEENARVAAAEGFELLRQDDYGAAAAAFQHAITLDRTFADAYFGWGIALLGRGGRETQADAKFRTALAFDPMYARAWLGLGLVRSGQGQYVEAEQSLRKAIELAPHLTEAHFQLGLLLLDDERDDDAISQFQDVVDIGRETDVTDRSPAAYFWIGQASSLAGRPGEALEAFVNSLALIRPSQTEALRLLVPWLHLSIGGAYVELRRYADALKSFREARESDPSVVSVATVAIGQVLALQGRYNESWVEYARSVQTGTEAAKKSLASAYHLVLGDVQFELGDLDSAETTYQDGYDASAAESAEPHPGLLAGLMRIYLEWHDEGRPARSADRAALAETPTEGFPGNSWFWEARRLFDEAEGLLKQDLQNARPSGSARYIPRLLRLSALNLVLGEHEGAQQFLDAALALKPENRAHQAVMHRHFGVVESRRERFREAAIHFDRALTLDPGDLATRTALAEAYLRFERLDAAEYHYRAVLRVAPCNISAKIGLGELLLERGDQGATDLYEAAIAQLKDARSLAERIRNSDVTRREGSNRLSKKQMAALSYDLAYGRVKMVEAGEARGRARSEFLNLALDDISRALDDDPMHFQAAAAKRRLAERRASERSWRDVVPAAVVTVLAVPIFVLLQVAFFWSWPHAISPEAYAPISFALLTFIAVAFYLRELLKLKVGTIEIEKAPVEQAAVATRLEIAKTPFPSDSRNIGPSVEYAAIRPTRPLAPDEDLPLGAAKNAPNAGQSLLGEVAPTERASG